jgi:hypothetical protein
MKQEKGLVKKETAALELPEDLQGSWGSEGVDASDIIIPKLLLMHGQSVKVLEGLKAQGELVRSTDWLTLAKRGEAVEVIPFQCKKVWMVVAVENGKKKVVREEAWTAANDKMPLEFYEDGKQLRRDKAYRFLALLSSDLEFPILLEFQRTSLRAGKVMADHFAKCAMFRRAPAMGKFSVGTEFVNGQDHKYFVFTAKMSGTSSLEEVAAAKQWHDLIATSSNVSVHDETETETEAAPF